MKNNKKAAKVTLVGAGPGDVGLITVKGIEAIKSADVILYDALVNEELLKNAPQAIKLFVGKRKGFKAYSQDEINELIVNHALISGHVVRLKGGDSYVFGRGSEELHYVESFGIEVKVVPGISSSISVPALAGIPVTHRGVSNSFFVLTGTLSNGALNPEIKLAAKSNGTVVILMGLGKLAQIVSVYRSEGKGALAVSVVSNGSLPNQLAVKGTIQDIEDKVNEQGVLAPAVIVIGEVVELQGRYSQVLNESFSN
jgi:uroporphyrin-III C-methyltransferase